MSKFRLLLKPLKSSVAWTSGGVASAWAVPQALSSFGLVYSSGIIATTMYVGGFAVLFPLGVARGVIGAVQDVTESSGKQAFARIAAASSNATPAASMSADSKYLLESLTWGSGWQGQLLRLASSPFMPSTAQMMIRAQEAVDLKGSSEPQVIAAAASGFMEGFLQDKKDTVTVLGLLGYSLIFCVGFAICH